MKTKEYSYLCTIFIILMFKKEALGEVFRFGIVGVLATAIHYGVYWLLQRWINVNVAFTIGYVVSFVANYLLSAHFTFRQQTSARNGAGFIAAHVCNYCLQLLLLNFFLWLGLSRAVAPIGVYTIAVPINFLMVRFVFKHFSHHHE